MTQARTVGWPAAVTGDRLAPATLDAMLDYCLGDDTRRQATRCAAEARRTLADVQATFAAAFGALPLHRVHAPV